MADVAELERLVEQFYGAIYRAALVMTGNAADADDLVQETFLQALEGHRNFAGRSRPQTWLYSILLNQHRRQLRSRSRRWRRWLLWFQRSGSVAEAEGPEQQLVRQQWQSSLWARVAELPASQRDAVVLRYAEGLSYEQIGEVLGCPVGTVKSRLHYARLTLEQQLTDYAPDGMSRGLPEAEQHARPDAADQRDRPIMRIIPLTND